MRVWCQYSVLGVSACCIDLYKDDLYDQLEYLVLAIYNEEK